jgi:hypothetical protein
MLGNRYKPSVDRLLSVPQEEESQVKAIKTIALSGLATVFVISFLGASTAMAESTSLCRADQNPCAAINQINSTHQTSVGKAKLLTSLGTTECTALFSGTTSGAGDPLVISGGFTYSNCTLAGNSCTWTEENGPAKISLSKEGHETAKVTGEYLIHVVCGTSIDCSYTGTNLVGTAKGPLLSAQIPDNGEIAISEQSLTKETGGFLCPKTGKLDVTTTPLVATSIVAEAAVVESTSWCRVDENPCSAAHQASSVHETSVGKAKLLTNSGTVECNVLFLGSISTALDAPLNVTGNFTWTGCALGATECTSAEENGPAKITVFKEGHDTASVISEYLVHIVCSGSIDCSYTGTNLVGTAKGSLLSSQANGEITLSEQTLAKETGGSLCPKTGKLDITTTPLESLFISS